MSIGECAALERPEKRFFSPGTVRWSRRRRSRPACGSGIRCRRRRAHRRCWNIIITLDKAPRGLYNNRSVCVSRFLNHGVQFMANVTDLKAQGKALKVLKKEEAKAKAKIEAKNKKEEAKAKAKTDGKILGKSKKGEFKEKYKLEWKSKGKEEKDKAKAAGKARRAEVEGKGKAEVEGKGKKA